MKAVILTILIFVYGQTFSQDADWDKVDNYVASLQLDKNISMDNLVSTLTKSFANPTLKTRAIYYWIARNIEYDYVGYETDYWNNYPSYQALLTDTYKFKKGICSGYSHLFKYMLNKAKIECEVVRGYARGDLRTVIAEKANHAWNVVKLDNKWYLFDVTWASDTLKGKVTNFWFKTAPDIFILNHYPETIDWTLLDKNISLDQFRNSPVYTKSFVDMSIVGEFSKNGYFQTVDNMISIDLKTTKKYFWLAKLYDLGKDEWFSPIEVEDRAYENGYIKLTMDRKGRFILRLNALENGEDSLTIHEDLVYYVVECK